MSVLGSSAKELATAYEKGNVIKELSRCSADAPSLGCYLNRAPASMKSVIALIASLIPSASEMKSNIKETIIPKGELFVSNDNIMSNKLIQQSRFNMF